MDKPQTQSAVGSTRLSACPSCGFKHPKLMKKERRRKDLNSGIWKDASEYSVKCPMCLMQAGPVEMDSVWPVKCWNTRKQDNACVRHAGHDAHEKHKQAEPALPARNCYPA